MKITGSFSLTLPLPNHSLMQIYLDLLHKIVDSGSIKQDRTGTGTRSIFGYQMRFDLSAGFPMLTTKKLHIKSIIHELLWFISGDTNVRYLKENGVSIWNEWANADGDLGPVYGAQWRNWNNEGIDQLSNVIEEIRKNPDSRRLIVSAWNPSVLPDTRQTFSANVSAGKAALPPCHALYQFYVSEGKLACQLFQRSADVFLGVPFNIASYALLTMMVAQVCDLKPGDFIHTFGDVHLYNNHLEQAQLQLTRLPGKLPQLRINPQVRNITEFTFSDFELTEYEAQAHIKAAVSI